MPRARTHLTWRVEGTRLQTLYRDIDGIHWVTVARGQGFDAEEEISKIAKALNRARFTLFDIRPVKSSTEKRR